MTCALSQNTVTMTTTNGRPPFKYEASIDNFATITRSIASTQDRTIAFNCLANGSYAFRVTDACNNIYTCNKVIQLAQLHAEWVCQGTGTIQLVSASGGTTPYTYLCYPRTGAVRTSTNGTFTGVTECRDSVVIHDACGGYFSQIVSCIFGNPTPLSLALTCSNGTLGTATVVATGGTPPYAFRETSSQVNNTTGHFTGLRNNVLFHFDVIDACGRTAFAEISSLNVFQQALECSWGVHLHTKQQRLATNTSGVFVDFSFKPVTYKCLTCVPQITLTDAVGDADNSVYFPTVGDAQLFEIKNGCGEKDTVEIGRASCITSDCNNNLYVLQTNTTIGGTTTVTLKNSAGVVLGTNTTGIFPNTPEGDYIITCHNPNGIPQTITYNYNLKLRIIGKREECDEVKIFYCPVNTSSTFKL
jgi:hypothetical protein